jgi:tRNA nucleotidyltransferase (CCA-adding enzyme)
MQLILTHSHSVFVARASQLAAARLYPGALAVLAGELNGNVREFLMLAGDKLPFLRAENLPRQAVERLILVDTAQPPRLPGFDLQRVPPLIIDHHPFERALEPYEQLIYDDVGATVTILARQLAERGAAIAPLEATLFLLGIYEDTGSLALPDTTAHDAASVAWLLGQGARIEAVAEFLWRPLSDDQERVYQALEATMRLVRIEGYSVLLASADVHGTVPQLSPLAHQLRDRYAPDALVIAIGTADAGTQLIFRSSSDTLDSGALAAEFGGGGHASAAAAFVRDRHAAELLREVERRLAEHVRPALTAADLMTRPVATVPLHASVAEAARLQQRSGHSALPVVDQRRVVHGLIARQELERAMRHQLGDAPVERYMWRGPALVSPGTSLAELRQALTQGQGRDTGRLLVVGDERRLLGIVTRTDLLRMWGEGFAGGRDAASQAADALERFLDPAVLALLRQAAQVAERQGAALYVVGGTVRDMLLGQPAGDLDLLVEGDAVALASALAADYGGRMRGHPQFHTATVEFDAGWEQAVMPSQAGAPAEPAERPLALDFVTARTEFYEHPAALPAIESASLRHDLHRRDFTINTLAVCLNPSRYGQLFDYYGGRRDLERRLVRVIHNLSFIDDPTRIVRAARLATRLDFTIEPRTLALIGDAINQDLLGRTSGQRVLHELELTLAEAHPERALALLAEIGALHAIHAALTWSPEQARWFERARAGHTQAELHELLFLLLTYPLDAQQRADLAARLPLGGRLSRAMHDVSLVQGLRDALGQPALADSALERLLRDVDELALRAARIAEAQPVAARIAHFMADVRPRRGAVGGDTLRALGIAPGPVYRTILDELRAAFLDGEVTTEQEQQAWVRAHYAEHIPG